MLNRKLLAKLIEARWESTEEFSKEVKGLSLRTIQNMLSLDCQFALSSVQAVARALGVNAKKLLIL